MNFFIPYKGGTDVGLATLAFLTKLSYWISDNLYLNNNFCLLLTMNQEFEDYNMLYKAKAMLLDQEFLESDVEESKPNIEEGLIAAIKVITLLQNNVFISGRHRKALKDAKTMITLLANEYKDFCHKRFEKVGLNSLIKVVDDSFGLRYEYESSKPENPSDEEACLLSSIMGFDEELYPNERPILLLSDLDYPEFATDKLPFKTKIFELFNINTLIGEELKVLHDMLFDVNAPIRAKLSQWERLTMEGSKATSLQFVEQEIAPLFKPMEDILLNSPITKPIVGLENIQINIRISATELSYEQFWEHCKTRNVITDETYEALHEEPYLAVAERRIPVLMIHNSKPTPPTIEEDVKSVRKSLDID